MPDSIRRALMLGLAAFALPIAAGATPNRYRLDPKMSEVGFDFVLGGGLQHGTMPVEQAEILIDPSSLGSARVDVTVRADAARTGLLFATQAMTGPEVLDVARHPTIRFRSTRVRLGSGGRISDGAQLRGLLTLRGVTRPIVLDASLYRPRGTAADDLRTLTIRLTGTLSRSAFGASGYSDLVADTVKLNIRAVIHAD